MKDIRLSNLSGQIDIINDNRESDDYDLLLNKKSNIEYLFVKGKSINFKIILTKQFIFLDGNYIFTSLSKLFFGIIALFIPLLIIIILAIKELYDREKYLFFPYFISLSVILGTLLFLLVIKIGEACQMNDLLMFIWKRKNIYRIIDTMNFGIFRLWLLFVGEYVINNLNVLKEKVAQSNSNDSSHQIFDKGSLLKKFYLYYISFF